MTERDTNTALRQRIARLEAELSTARCTIATLRQRLAEANQHAFDLEGIATQQEVKLAQLRQPGPCGHPGACRITTVNGDTLCGWCEAEQAQYHAGRKAGEAEWFAKWAEMARDAYGGEEQLAIVYFGLFREPPPAGQKVTAEWLVAKVQARCDECQKGR